MPLAKIGFMRRFFTWSQKRLMEKQNPELASVMRKLERLGPSPDPRQAQQVISRFTRAEKRPTTTTSPWCASRARCPRRRTARQRRQQQRMQGPTEAERRRARQEGRQAPPLSRALG